MKPQHHYDFPAVQTLYVQQVGEAVWFNEILALGREQFGKSMRAYHRNIILTNSQATSDYLDLLGVKLTAYRSFLLN